MPGIAFVVDAKDKHRGVIFRWGGQDDFLGPGSEVLFGGGLVQEQAGGLDHHLGTNIGPFQIGRIALLGQTDFFTVDAQGVARHTHLAFEAAVHAVVLQHVGQVVRLEQVVDANDLDVGEILHR